MNPPGLFDGSFAHQNSVSFGGDRLGESPASFQWLRGKPGQDVTFYTDQCLDIVLEQIQLGIPGRKVAWLIEPPSLHNTHYIAAARMENVFDYILTFNAALLNRGEQWLYYPCGGSWIAPSQWGMQHKTKSISLIVSEKTKAPGHKLRREILEKYGDRLDVYGRGVRPVESKVEALRDYRYSIVVESIRLDGYFSEKLIDCISQGTVPIYWGDPAIGDPDDLYRTTDGLFVEVRGRFTHIEEERWGIANGGPISEQHIPVQHVLRQHAGHGAGWLFGQTPFGPRSQVPGPEAQEPSQHRSAIARQDDPLGVTLDGVLFTPIHQIPDSQIHSCKKFTGSSMTLPEVWWH